MPRLIFPKRVTICDFCSSEDVKWSYECTDFETPLPNEEPWVSTGGWAACQTCKDFIEADDWVGLRGWAVKQFFIHRPEVPNVPRFRSHIDGRLRIIYARFAELKTELIPASEYVRRHSQ
jgi:hypothetical protein